MTLSLRSLLGALAALSVACVRPAAAQRTPASLVAASPAQDPVLAAFRVLLDDVIGDSADTLCVGIASTPTSRDETDPSASVLRALKTRGVTIWPHSHCAADEQNYGPTRGALRLLEVAPQQSGALLVTAEAIADHTARYECLVPRRGARWEGGRCRLVSLK